MTMMRDGIFLFYFRFVIMYVIFFAPSATYIFINHEPQSILIECTVVIFKYATR